MKVTHNVILIIVSSKWSSFFFPELFIMSFSRFEMLHLFFFVVPSSLNYLVAKLHLIIARVHLVFSTSLSLYHPFITEFFMEALHGGSSRILFILQLFFKISLEVMTRQAILKIKHGAQHMFSFEAFKYCPSCISKCNSF